MKSVVQFVVTTAAVVGLYAFIPASISHQHELVGVLYAVAAGVTLIAYKYV